MMYRINAPVWRFPKVHEMEKIIIAIDRQKPWERVIDYSRRVVALFDSKKMSVKYDDSFMGRVFLGGLKKNILDVMLDDVEIPFKEANIHAEFLEYWLQHGTVYRNVYAGSSDADSGENSGEDSGEDSDSYSDVDEDEEYEEEEGAFGGFDIVEPGLYVGDYYFFRMEQPDTSAYYGFGTEEPRTAGVTGDGASIILNGEEIFGEPNERVDEIYNAHYVLILYR